MNAADLIWRAADETDLAPRDALADLAPRARQWVEAWLRTPREGCPHGGIYYAPAGARRMLCASCAEVAGVSALGAYCGRCFGPTGEGARFAVWAAGDNVIALLALCRDCASDDHDERSTR